jgi:4,5-DOPA dioxygenase extradiol
MTVALPVLFLAHGSPMLAIEQTPYASFLDSLAKGMPRPKAIVIFTAHWETEATTVSSSDGVYETIYDFRGFPDELYQVTYPASGSSAVASVVIERLRGAGLPVGQDVTRGLDHGSWTLLYRMYPEADVPVVQVSVNPDLPPVEQVRIGEALRGLGEEGILVIGSGVTVHNLRAIQWGQTEPEPWAVAFDDWLLEQTLERKTDELFGYERLAPHARMAVPRAEHFVPYFIAFGAGREGQTPEVIHRSYQFGTLSYLSMQF